MVGVAWAGRHRAEGMSILKTDELLSLIWHCGLRRSDLA